MLDKGDFHIIFAVCASLNNHNLKVALTPRQLFDVSVKLVRSQKEHLVHVQQDAVACVQMVIQK